MTNKNYDPIITGLRAYSIIAVLIFHFFHDLFPWLAGYKGVDVFFVISGYLIIGHITQATNENRFSLSVFYAKRVIRLFPALLVMLCSVLALGFLFLLSEEYRSLAKYVFGSIFFYTNIISWQEINYFDANAELKPLVHMWSLGVEEQFYAAFPVLAFFVAFYRKRMLPYLLAFTLLSMLLCLILSRSMPAATFYLLPTRFWEIGIGGLIAVTAHDKGLIEKLRQRIKSNIEIGFCLILASLCFQVQGFYFFDIVLAVLGAACIMLNTEQTGIGRKVLDNGVVDVIGRISYPLYIFHFPVLAAYAITGYSFSMGDRVVALGLLCGLAYVVYRFVETPIARAPREIALGLLGVFSILVVAGSSYVYLHAGLPGRIAGNDEFNKDVFSFHDYKKKFKTCTLVDNANCLLSERSDAAAPKVVVLGDSHADHSFPGIADAFADRGVLFFGVPSCPPLIGIISYDYGDKYACTRMNERVSAYLAEQKSIELVILTFAMPFYYTDKGMAYQHLGPNEPMLWNVESVEPFADRFAAVSRSLKTTVEYYLKAGKQVVLMLDAPELPFMPSHCIDRGDYLRPQNCTISKVVYLQRQQSIRAFIQMELAGKKNFFLYDPAAIFCDDKECRIRTGERFLYRDSNHLSVYGSRKVGDDLRKFVSDHNLLP
jgi:peptidoglycan/LPS O-acetylase OafA/YrhL